MKRNFTVVLAAAGLSLVAGCSAIASASVPTDPATSSKPSASATSTPPIADTTTGTSGTTSVGTNDGTTVQVPWVGGSIVTDGDTRNSVQMPSIHKLLNCDKILVTWADLPTCANDAQWYKDGIDRFASRSGFTWANIDAWSKAKTIDGNVPEARVIMLTGKMTQLTDADANDRLKALTGNTTLQVIRLDQAGYTNTWRTGTQADPGMTPFVDYNSEARVTLVPLVLDANGNVTGLNTQLKFSGVFVDCLNDHWIDTVTPTVPTVVVCPPGTTMAGQPLPSNGYAGCTPPTTSNSKNPKDSVGAVQGTVPLPQTKPITDGKTSAGQKAAGDTSGSVTDSKVSAGTKSGTTTSDIGTGSGVTAPGASSGGDTTTGTTSGAGQTNTGAGGTSGDGKIADPNLP